MAFSPYMFGTCAMTHEQDALCADFCHLIHNHRAITHQDWMWGSPQFGVVKYQIPEFDMMITRHMGQKTIKTKKPKRMVELKFTCWRIESANVLVEILRSESFKIAPSSDSESTGTTWKHCDSTAFSDIFISDQIPNYEITHYGDLSEFEGMIAYHKLMYDWN
jgi:hypothetical protein